MATADGVIEQFRQPEYTGENRCLPCTAVNTLMGTAMSGGVAAVGAVYVSPVVGIAAGAALFGLSMLTIYLRGYLVPKTPELTKRYFPPWLLALFGKEPVLERHQHIEVDEEFDPERALVQVGALEECPDGDDLCLTDGFRDAWHDELAASDTEAEREPLLELLDIDAGDVEYDEFGRAFRARLDGTVVGKWESEAAFVADLAAARVFAEHYPEWDELSVTARGQLLNGLRLFLDTCPGCGGAPSFDAETVESCCSTYDVAAVTCGDCDARLFEARVDA